MAIVDTINSMYENVGEVYDTITNVDLPTNKNIENIPSTIRKSYLDIMNNGYQDIYDNWEKVNGTGTSISLNNTEEAPMTIEYKGNTSMLPKGYTQVEYIESTGTQYIDTGVNTDSKMSIDIDYQFTLQGTASYENCFGVINGSGAYLRYHFETRTADSLSFSYYHNNVINTYEGFYTDRVRTFVDMNNLRMRTWKNGTIQLYTNIQDFGDWDSELNFWLFRRNSNTTNLQYFSKNRVYYCKMYASSVLVRFFIPCYRNRDNAIGLYDIVNNQFYANQGTGTFVKGNDVTPSTSGLSIPTPTYPQDIHIVSGDNYINVCGKNLFDDSVVTNLWSNYNTQEIINVNEANLHKYDCKQGDTFTLSATFGSASGNGAILIQFFDENSNNLGRYAVSNYTTLTLTRTAPANTSYAYIGRYLTTPTTIQLEKGSTATEYEEYKGASYEINLGDIELCKIGTYQDYIYKDNGSWYLHKEIGKVVLNGSENWNNDGGTQGTDYRHNIYYASRMSIPIAKGTNGTYLSNYFATRNVSSDRGELGTFYMSNSWLVFVDKNKVYDLTQWKTWLASNNTIVYYVLATPTYEKITGELLNQLEAIKKSYENQTNINQENNDLPFILDVTALKQLTQ